MANPNTGFLFYQKYFKDQPGALDTTMNAKITAISSVEPIAPISYLVSAQTVINQQSIELITTYPGLLVGSGYSHDVKGDKSEDSAFKLGFYFDHSTGMPVIPGSSVKGVLRSLFPSQYKKRAVDDNFRNPRYELIADFINQRTGLSLNHTDRNDRAKIDAFEKEIFDGVYQGKSKTIYSRDIFFDAVPVAIEKNYKKTEQRLFGNDYITPHKNKDGHPELDPFSNPTPLQFLKVMPLVKYEFRFCLHKSCAIVEMTADKKRELFEMLILFSGIGAKTNVGYGQFELTEKDKQKQADLERQKAMAEKVREEQLKQKEREKDPEYQRQQKLKKDSEHECIISKLDKNYCYFRFDWDKDFEFKKKIGKTKIDNPQLKMKVKIKITAPYLTGDDVNFTIIETTP